jgi:hypothetical protein
MTFRRVNEQLSLFERNASVSESTKIGIVYVAYGDRFVAEAIQSALSVRRHNPGLPICLISDTRKTFNEFDFQVRAERHNPVIRGKLEMFNSPFDLSLFLDTDTIVCAPLDEIFELLKKFEIVFQQTSTGYHYKLEGVPNAFPEPNTGVIGFVKSDRIVSFSESWRSYFDRYVDVMEREWDQRSFRHAIYESGLRFSVLPTEYNFMTYFPQYAMTELKIVHGRPKSACDKLQKVMDQKLGPRVYVPRIGYIGHYNQMGFNSMLALIANAIKMLAFEGMKRTVRAAGLYSVVQRAAKGIRTLRAAIAR